MFLKNYKKVVCIEDRSIEIILFNLRRFLDASLSGINFVFTTYKKATRLSFPNSPPLWSNGACVYAYIV